MKYKYFFRYTLYLSVFIFVFLIGAGCTTTDAGSPRPEKQNAGQWAGTDTVTTVYGRVSGRTYKGVYRWLGIPYAQPPVGDLRWKAPREPEPWAGELKAVHKPSQCLQYTPLSKKGMKGSEDCLYLNIWRPVSDTEKLPVYVWIHGGGNTTGSSVFTADYLGSNFVEATEAIFVSLNYRLGPFGWFTHPAVRETSGDSLDASGNYGLLDLQQGLKWISENIEAFGGDTSNVTIAGESAGAFNIIALLRSSLSRGLFHKALIRSGGIVQSPMQEGDTMGDSVIRRLLENEGVSEKDRNLRLKTWSSEETASYLRSADSKDILRCFEPGIFGMISMPYLFLDGTVLPEYGTEDLTGGSYPMKIPLIIGTNRDEMKIFWYWNRELRKSNEVYQAAARLGSDLWRVQGADSLVRTMLKSSGQPEVFHYYFTWGSMDERGESVLPGGWGKKLGAFHSLENPFFHGNITKSQFAPLVLSGKNRAGAGKLQNAVLEYIRTFVWTPAEDLKRIVPQDTSLPPWEPWEDDSPRILVLDADFQNLEISLSGSDYTMESVYRNLKESIPESIYEASVQFVQDNRLHFMELQE